MACGGAATERTDLEPEPSVGESVSGDAELKARALAFYNASDPSRWGREELPALYQEFMTWIGSGGVSGGLILDLGCGQGPLRSCSPAYVGVDISLPALQRWSKEARAVQADMEQLPFRDGSVGTLVSIAALEHVPRPDRVLEEINRVLEQRGVAFLAPAWFCRPWAAEGLPAKKYRELNWLDRLRKAAIPLRNSVLLRGCRVLPRRLWREARAAWAGASFAFEYARLRPNLRHYVYTDCDAFASMDPHSMLTFFRTRGYEVLNARDFVSRVFFRSAAVVVRKPAPHPASSPSIEVTRIGA